MGHLAFSPSAVPPSIVFFAMRLYRLFRFLASLVSAIAMAAQAASLQTLVDQTPSGGVLIPPPGVYHGMVVVDRPMVIDGMGKVIVDGDNQGSVLWIKTSGVTLRGLTIMGSGESLDQLDAGIRIEGDRNQIEQNDLRHVLFGMVLKQANENRVQNNRIRSKDLPLSQRGDGLRLWYAGFNRIEGNRFTEIRDISLANSGHNRLSNNHLEGGRVAVHMVFSPRTLIDGNRFSNTLNGVVAINSDGLQVRQNRIMHVLDGSGAAVSLKETNAALVFGNDIIHCGVGILSDSPNHPINRIALVHNRIAHNITGISFYGERGGHWIQDNAFEKNLNHALVYGTGIPLGNDWWQNYWDDYEGFDRDGDGIGDFPHEVHTHADRIWLENPMASFFRKSPVLELLDFLERLAPFAIPELHLRDLAPRMGPARFPWAEPA